MQRREPRSRSATTRRLEEPLIPASNKKKQKDCCTWESWFRCTIVFCMLSITFVAIAAGVYLITLKDRIDSSVTAANKMIEDAQISMPIMLLQTKEALNTANTFGKDDIFFIKEKIKSLLTKANDTNINTALEVATRLMSAFLDIALDVKAMDEIIMRFPLSKSKATSMLVEHQTLPAP